MAGARVCRQTVTVLRSALKAGRVGVSERVQAPKKRRDAAEVLGGVYRKRI